MRATRRQMPVDTTIVTVNTGSSSVRLAAFALDEHHGLAALASERHELAGVEAAELLSRFAAAHPPAAAVAHRVVHGGTRLVRSRLIDVATEREIERLAPLAPLHNPTALQWIAAARDVCGPETAQVAVFDTAFYADLPEDARTYAIPHDLAGTHAIRRYGFHGLAHRAMWERWRELAPGRARAKLISLQLGAGCSITAIEDGRPQDTSMGFSPLEGLVMATRSGDLDPGAILYLQRTEHLTPEDADQLLNARSGLLGMSGLSGDIGTLLESVDPRARGAVGVYCYRARKYIGAYLAVLGGADAIVFGGGVGEHVPAVRAAILDRLAWAGVRLDARANEATIGREGRISRADSGVDVWVIPVDEQRVLAAEALTVTQR